MDEESAAAVPGAQPIAGPAQHGQSRTPYTCLRDGVLDPRTYLRTASVPHIRALARSSQEALGTRAEEDMMGKSVCAIAIRPQKQ